MVSRRTEWLLLVLAAAVIVAFHADLKKPADPEQVRRLAQQSQKPEEWRSKVAPDFELALRDGTTFSLADHVGKEVVILNFFATWCAPCRAEAPELNRYATAMRGHPVVLVGIDASETPARVDAYVKEFGVPYPVGIDGAVIQARYGVQSFPTTVVIDAQGRIALYEMGAIMNSEVAFGGIVDAQIAEIRAGRGISREAYLARAKEERYGSLAESDESSASIVLNGRAATLAEQMDCLCGCKDKLLSCQCSRADNMKKKVAALATDATKSDTEIMTAVNAEFCVREKKEM